MDSASSVFAEFLLSTVKVPCSLASSCIGVGAPPRYGEVVATGEGGSLPPAELT